MIRYAPASDEWAALISGMEESRPSCRGDHRFTADRERPRHHHHRADESRMQHLPAAPHQLRLRIHRTAPRRVLGGRPLGKEDMNQPTSIAVVSCPGCSPWVRWWRTGSGAWVRQEQHEPHCGTFPHIRRSHMNEEDQ